MMLFIGILMLYLVGASVLVKISKAWSWKEMISISFLIGIAGETFFMFLMDVVGFQFTELVLFLLSFAVLIFSYDDLYTYYEGKKKDINLGNWSLKTLNYPAVILLFVILGMLYIITAKNLYWPTTERDSIASFDKLGIVMAREGVLKISLFQYGIEGSGAVYPPLFHGGIAYLYLFGAEQPKILTTLFFVSLLIGFYSFLKKQVPTFWALFFTLLLEMVPEMYSHAALLLGNMPTTAYVGLGALALFVWKKENDEKYFILATLLITLVLWIRSDTIGFSLASILLVAMQVWRAKDFKRILLFSISVLMPLLVWTLYLKLKIGAAPVDKFQFHFIGDGKKITLMLAYIFDYFSWFQVGNSPPGIVLYGLTFLLFFVALILNAKNILKDRIYILGYLLVSFAIYFLVFLFLDEKLQGAPISSLMESSFKRGMFCFIPIVLFYTATSTTLLKLAIKMENFRTGK